MNEPNLITETKNTVLYLVLLCVLTGGVLLVLAGAISPLFLPAMLQNAKKKAFIDKTGTYSANLRKYNTEAIVRVCLWFILSWGFLVFAYHSSIF
jgi:hypothetical protein